MSEELFKAIEEFDWSDTQKATKYKIHYNPDKNGVITQIGADGHTNSDDPHIEVDSIVGEEFIAGKRYNRHFHVKDKKLERRPIQASESIVSDSVLQKVTNVDQVDVGTYFITVKGDPDLVIDTVVVDLSNKEIQLEKIKEYLENNDCYKDK